MDLDKVFFDETEEDIQPKTVRPWNVEGDEESPEIIIRKNIERANRILDVALDSIERGLVEARIIEVAIKAVESVTTAAMALNTTAIGFGKLDLEEDMLEIKHKELELKAQQAVLGAGGVKNQTNIIVASREEVMAALINAEVPQLEDGDTIDGEIIDGNFDEC